VGSNPIARSNLAINSKEMLRRAPGKLGSNSLGHHPVITKADDLRAHGPFHHLLIQEIFGRSRKRGGPLGVVPVSANVADVRLSTPYQTL
jgi:hypothetical protein